MMMCCCCYCFVKVDDCIYIFEGWMIVFLNIDEVICIICELDELKVVLMSVFGFSEW